MIVIDANLLLYAYSTTSPHHAAARSWLERVLSEPAPVGLPWTSISAFLRIATHSALPGRRLTIEEGTTIVRQWLDQPNVRVLVPGENHWRLLERMLLEGQARGPLVSDAQLAALTIEHGGTLCTTDRDFARFPDLRWKNPLAV